MLAYSTVISAQVLESSVQNLEAPVLKFQRRVSFVWLCINIEIYRQGIYKREPEIFRNGYDTPGIEFPDLGKYPVRKFWWV